MTIDGLCFCQKTSKAPEQEKGPSPSLGSGFKVRLCPGPQVRSIRRRVLPSPRGARNVRHTGARQGHCGFFFRRLGQHFFVVLFVCRYALCEKNFIFVILFIGRHACMHCVIIFHFCHIVCLSACTHALCKVFPSYPISGVVSARCVFLFSRP